MQKGIRLNDGHVASLGLLARKDGTRKGYLSKRSSDNTKWVQTLPSVPREDRETPEMNHIRVPTLGYF